MEQRNLNTTLSLLYAARGEGGGGGSPAIRCRRSRGGERGGGKRETGTRTDITPYIACQKGTSQPRKPPGGSTPSPRGPSSGSAGSLSRRRPRHSKPPNKILCHRERNRFHLHENFMVLVRSRPLLLPLSTTKAKAKAEERKGKRPGRVESLPLPQDSVLYMARTARK